MTVFVMRQSVLKQRNYREDVNQGQFMTHAYHIVIASHQAENEEALFRSEDLQCYECSSNHYSHTSLFNSFVRFCLFYFVLILSTDVSLLL